MSQVTLELTETSTSIEVDETNAAVNVTETFTTLDLGNAGPQGIQGVVGPANTLTVGTVTKSSDDTAVVTITGTSPAQTIDFVLPRGLQGIQGIQGERGEVGQTGSVGPKGDTGNTGATGSVGPAGEIGPQGIQGIQGEVGPVGPAGADSTVPGPQGEQGIQGEVGPAGADSTVPGPEGPQGEPGADSTVPGPEGPEGPPGADSTVPGPQGEQGEVGPGVAAGGTEGQILAKVDDTNYNTTWIDNFASQVKHQVMLGEAISKGQAVYVSSASGTNMIVSKADNTTEAASSKVMGLLETGGSTNAQVNVVTEGLLAGLNTAAAEAGDAVWLGTAGNLLFNTVNKPLSPAHLVYIGVVTRKNANNGEIFIQPQNGFELRELHDVLAQTPSNNQVLTYSTATSLWTPQTQTVTINGTAVALGGTITVNARLA
jgi:hypothetical protein